MALQKSKELPSGVSGNYWKIIQPIPDPINLQLSVKVALYKDQETAEAKKQNLGIVHSFVFSVTKEQLLGNLFSLGYTLIKAQCAGAAPSPMSGKLMAHNDLKNAIDV